MVERQILSQPGHWSLIGANLHPMCATEIGIPQPNSLWTIFAASTGFSHLGIAVARGDHASVIAGREHEWNSPLNKCVG